MAIATPLVILTLGVYLALIVGGILLQIFLSKRESKWPGLILPCITFCYALIMLLGVAVYDGMGGGEIFATLATVFLMGNIPTFILLGIYFACREKKKQRAQLEKMNKMDLE